MIYLKHTPEIIKPLAKNLVFDLPNQTNEIYLTFDDGPHPEITTWVLDLLKQHKALATFFVIGKNVLDHPDLISRILKERHSIGNHSQTHLSGWKTPNETYFSDVKTCQSVIESNLFRPPYGQITHAQSQVLKNDFQIIMWSDLSADFDENVSVNQCVKHATEKIKPGSIIVFHDNEKAWPRLKKALPRCLEYYRKQGFIMSPIPMA